MSLAVIVEAIIRLKEISNVMGINVDILVNDVLANVGLMGTGVDVGVSFFVDIVANDVMGHVRNVLGTNIKAAVRTVIRSFEVVDF